MPRSRQTSGRIAGGTVGEMSSPLNEPPEDEHEVVPTTPEEEVPLEEQRYSRGNLFRSLGGLVADRGIMKIDEVKSRLTDEF